jgi:hypothetical protein
MPKGYISAKGNSGMVPWSRAQELLERANGYWLSTTDPDGRPHLVQQWGAWLDGRWHFEGNAETRWARNVARESRVAMSVERGTEIVIVYGVVRAGRSPSPEFGARLAREYARKYGRTHNYRPKPTAWDEGGLYTLEPDKALSWDVKTFGKSPTRFLFAKP